MSRRLLEIDWDAQPLGQMTDAALAARLGVSWGVVQSQRSKRGIPSFRGKLAIDWAAQPLGVMPDGELAKRLGVSMSTVRYNRERLDIAPYRPRRDWSALESESNDARLAQHLGVTRQAVYQQRHKAPRRVQRRVIFYVPAADFERWQASADGLGISLGDYITSVLYAARRGEG